MSLMTRHAKSHSGRAAVKREFSEKCLCRSVKKTDTQQLYRFCGTGCMNSSNLVQAAANSSSRLFRDQRITERLGSRPP
jgi:hypothetical protein